MLTADASPRVEPSISLPTWWLVITVCSASVACGLTWMAITGFGGWARDVVLSGPMAAGIVGAVSVAGVIVMAPWKTRLVGWWMTMWLAATVLRLIATPALTFLLYSATSLNAIALTLAVAATYLVVLLAETSVLARHVNRVLYS